MNSFILVSKSMDKQQSYLKSFAKKNKISQFDQNFINEEGSIGIELVRKLQTTLFLKPYKSEFKMIIVQNAHNLTLEAQNALLKLLEEPPVFVYLFLCAVNEQTFLPTIISRCQIINFEEEEKILPEEEKKVFREQLAALYSGTVNQKLALAEKLAADKENLGSWFENIIFFLHKDIKEYPQIILELQKAHKTFSTTNVNPRIILEHTFLGLSNK